MAQGDPYCWKHGFQPCRCDGDRSLQDETTRPRRPSSIMRATQWGLIQSWLAEHDARGVVLGADTSGLTVTAIDPIDGTRIENVAAEEDPSRTILRAISRMKQVTG
jgi:hypothetical protein